MSARARVVNTFCIAALVVVLSSCASPIALWVIPGSTADNLVFGFSESRKSKARGKPGDIKVFPAALLAAKR